ncbi:MAG: hypothetical protein ABEJ72_03540 [Candidatus Aenigmatarchaeota archaeon]
MAEVGTQEHLKDDLKMRIGAALVVISVFFGLGHIKRTDFLGLAGLLEGGPAFFTAALGLTGAVWILYFLYLFYLK